MNASTVQAINDGTILLRFYLGNITDTTYSSVNSGLTTMNNIGVNYEFNGFTEDHHAWNAWQQNLIDWAPRLFQHVDSVSVTPATSTVTLGWVKQFTADVATTHGASEAVKWSVEGAASAGTTISADGLLSVAADETASSLTVVATSVFDPTKAGSAQVTLAAPGTTEVKLQATAAPASVVSGGTFTLNVAVAPADGSKKTASVPTGEIAVTFGDTVQVVPLTGGKAAVSLPTTGLPPGVYTVNVAYSGDPPYAPYAANYQELEVR